VIGRALAVDPASRYVDVQELGAALLPFASERSRALFGLELASAAGPPRFRPRLEAGGAGGGDETFDDAPRSPTPRGDAGPLPPVSVTQDTTRKATGLYPHPVRGRAALDRESDEWIVAHQLFAQDAAGDRQRAIHVAEELVARSAARPASPAVGENTLIAAIGYLARRGAIDWRRRDELGARALSWPDDANARATLDAELALALVASSDDARAALARLEGAATTVSPGLAVAHARALALAGRGAEAKTAIEGGKRGCDGLALSFLEATRLSRVGFD